MANKDNWFDDVEKETVDKGVEIPTTFQLPKLDEGSIEYEIIGEPFNIDTPESKYNKTASKLPVSLMGVKGEIFLPKSLKTNIAVSLEKMEKDFTKAKLNGMFITVWMQSGNDGFNYYHCSLRE